MSWYRRLVPEPFLPLLTFAWIVGLFSVTTAPIQDLWRPLIVGVLVAAFLTVLAVAVRPADRWLVLAAGSAWLVLIGAWPLGLGVAVVVVWRLLVDGLRRRTGRRPVTESTDRQALRVANALGVAAAIVAVLTLVNSGALRLEAPAVAATTLPPGDHPSIYLVLLDGYPATSVLAHQFGFDNGPFEAALEDRGFDVAEDPSSNYNRTILTLSSMLHMQLVDDIPGLHEVRQDAAGQTRQLTAAINRAPVPRMLEAVGYETISIGSSYGEASMTSANRVVSSGTLTMFEEQLIRYGIGGKWLLGFTEIAADQHRAGILSVIDHVGSVAQEAPGPVFVLGHVFSPHPPFVFAEDGSPRDLLPCYPEMCGYTTTERDRIGMTAKDYGDALTGQVTFLNSQLLPMVDRVVAADPNAVIVLFSDHGARFDKGPTAEHFRVFLAARTPGHHGLVEEPATLVNVLPAILNAYFDVDLPTAEDRRAWAPHSDPLRPEPVR